MNRHALAALLAAGPWIVDQVGVAAVTVASATPDGVGGVTDAGAIQTPVGAACDPSWLQTFGGGTGVPSAVFALTVFNDGLGGGEALYAGGVFNTAGGLPASKIAKWNGTSWSALGTGMSSSVFALTVFDDGLGGGEALYAGGLFTTAGGVAANRIAKWNGTTWSALGTGMNNTVNALTVFDDGLGGGPALYAGGAFTTAGGVAANRIAKWNGTSWSALGTGMNNIVRALTDFDDGLGGGPALYGGGDFSTAGGVTANRIAKWNGTSWSALSTGMTNGNVWVLDDFDDGLGGGPALYAGGNFPTAGAVLVNGMASWNGTSWSAVGPGMGVGTVYALTVFDDGLGGGPALYVGGFFIVPGTPDNLLIAKWDGTGWSPLDSGMNDAGGGPNSAVRALTDFDDSLGGGPALYAGGDFIAIDSGDTYLAKWGCVAAPPCPWDCGDQDGIVGVVDFLAVLSQWGDVGTSCDFDGGGTAVNDFLEVLAHWGACP